MDKDELLIVYSSKSLVVVLYKGEEYTIRCKDSIDLIRKLGDDDKIDMFLYK